MKIIPALKSFIYLFAGLFIVQSSAFWEHYELKGIGFGKNSTKITTTGIYHGSKPNLQTNLNQRFYQGENDTNTQVSFLAGLSSKVPLLPKEQPVLEMPAQEVLSLSPYLLHRVLRI